VPSAARSFQDGVVLRVQRDEAGGQLFEARERLPFAELRPRVDQEATGLVA